MLSPSDFWSFLLARNLLTFVIFVLFRSRSLFSFYFLLFRCVVLRVDSVRVRTIPAAFGTIQSFYKYAQTMYAEPLQNKNENIHKLPNTNIKYASF